jgi:predicted O-methyltransferase YrrM
MDERWAAVDEYLSERLAPGEAALTDALAANAAAGLVAADVSPAQGRLLELLARLCGARAILEIGTLGGYSTIWLARALPPDGRLITLEVNPKHAEVAQDNIAAAGLADRVELRIGPAIETLPKLAAEGLGPFDLIFIDADKPSNAEYFVWALELSRPGTLIIVDNVVRSGEVVDPDNHDPRTLGVHRLNDVIAAEPRVSATAVQTVGRKGHDGFVLALVNDL